MKWHIFDGLSHAFLAVTRAFAAVLRTFFAVSPAESKLDRACLDVYHPSLQNVRLLQFPFVVPRGSVLYPPEVEQALEGKSWRGLVSINNILKHG